MAVGWGQKASASALVCSCGIAASPIPAAFRGGMVTAYYTLLSKGAGHRHCQEFPMQLTAHSRSCVTSQINVDLSIPPPCIQCTPPSCPVPLTQVYLRLHAIGRHRKSCLHILQPAPLLPELQQRCRQGMTRNLCCGHLVGTRDTGMDWRCSQR